jgi:ribosome-associated heat shock protein Hsp15
MPLRRESDLGKASGSITSVRLDVWLWAARFHRTRSLAKQAIEAGHVAINGVAGKPAKAVVVGDRIAVTRGEERIEVVVAALSEQRGPASVAQTLYVETEASAAARAAARELRRLTMAGQAKPPTRPDKRARRQLLDFLKG